MIFSRVRGRFLFEFIPAKILVVPEVFSWYYTTSSAEKPELSVVTRLWEGQLSNRGSILGRATEFPPL